MTPFGRFTLLLALTLMVGSVEVRTVCAQPEPAAEDSAAEDSAAEDSAASEAAPGEERAPDAEGLAENTDGDAAEAEPADAEPAEAEPAEAEPFELPDDLDADDGGDDFFGDIPDDVELEEPRFFEPITFSLTSTTVVQYRFDNYNTNETDDDFLGIWERLEPSLQLGDFRLTARLDAFLKGFDTECPPTASNCGVDNDVRLERLGLHYGSGPWSVDAGDSYAVLGRGIALSLRRVDQLGVDNSLQGGQAAYNGRRVYAKVLGGAVNPQNLDPQTLQIRRDPEDQLRFPFDARDRDMVVGGEGGVRLPLGGEGAPTLDVGVLGQATYFANTSDRLSSLETTLNVFGGHMSLPDLADGALNLYVEANAMRRFRQGSIGTRDVDDREWGHAIYGAAQFQQGSLGIALEWKEYANFLLSDTIPLIGENQEYRIYGAQPTLERDAERPRHLYNARGGRVQVDYGFAPGPWSMSGTFLAYAHAESPDVNPWQEGILVTHPSLKVQRVNDALGADEIGWTLDVEVGYRRETWLVDTVAFASQRGDSDWQVWHGKFESGVVFGEHSLELTIDQRSEEQRLSGLLKRYERGTASLTYSWRGRVRVAPTLGWNTEFPLNPTYYPALEARFDFLEGSFLRVFGGQTPAGIICSGGVCREVPAFEGVLTELVIRL
ncbi:MAG: hypothetical protein AAF447_06390 [Myxococcota bacterium]